MKIVSFNVNSVRQRLHQLERLVTQHQPDIIGLQETKVQDHDFPVDALAELGYHSEYYGQKTHYGVALLSKQTPLSVQKGFASDDDAAQKRLIIGTFAYGDQTITVLNGYFPQGEKRSHETKFPAKQAFYRNLITYIEHLSAEDRQRIVIMGDFNIAPADLDVGIGEQNAKRWLRDGKTSFLPEERQWLQELMALGFVDSFRHHQPQSTQLSWFDYRSRGFDAEPKRGLRIDYILLPQTLQHRIRDTGIDHDIRAMEKPSDHCPVWVTL